MRLSFSSEKAIFVEQLENVRVKTRDEVKDLAHKFDSEGQATTAEITVATFVRMLQPTRTPHELARLAHVLEDLRHLLALQCLHKKLNPRALMEEERHDPWSAEFVQFFNSDEYLPKRPDSCNAVTRQLLDAFDHIDHPQ